MSLADIVRSGVATAHKITNDGQLQETVTLRRWIDQDDSSAPEYAASVSLPAVVERGDVNLRTTNGETIIATTTVTFVQPFAGVTATGRREPIDPRDQIVLADGSSSPILRIDGGVVDVATGRPFVTTVYMR